MCQVAHITEHTAILGHRLLGGIIARIDGVRTHIGEDASQQQSGKLLGEVEAGESVVGVKAKVVTFPARLWLLDRLRSRLSKPIVVSRQAAWTVAMDWRETRSELKRGDGAVEQRDR